MSAPRALVLTAGLGSRLRPLTYVRAKAAVPVNGETLARRVVRWLVSQGVTDLVLNLHHRPESITGSVGDGADLGARVRYSWEQPLLGSGGGPRHALPLLVDGFGPAKPGPQIQSPESRVSNPGSQVYFIVNGDTLTNVNLTALHQRHARSGARVTMALIANPRPEKYGGVVVNASAVVTGFTRPGAVRENYHFVGVQCVDASVFAALPDGVPAESVNGVYKDLLASAPGSVAAFVSNARFQDIGTPADYLRTSIQLAAVEGDHMASSQNVQVAPSAVVRGTAVWDDVVIGADSTLVDCIVADGARIPPHVRYERCAIVPAGGRAAGAGEQIAGELLIVPFD
ncbi:MAG: mannose-phosphate guanylyltransferase [Acidobacteriota bacterium]|jgi:NDP-sugar pyrophosphorylase family protein